jgi:hypothetical protein
MGPLFFLRDAGIEVSVLGFQSRDMRVLHSHLLLVWGGATLKSWPSRACLLPLDGSGNIYDDPLALLYPISMSGAGGRA